MDSLGIFFFTVWRTQNFFGVPNLPTFWYFALQVKYSTSRSSTATPNSVSVQVKEEERK